jgi:hypothetical protein
MKLPYKIEKTRNETLFVSVTCRTAVTEGLQLTYFSFDAYLIMLMQENCRSQSNLFVWACCLVKFTSEFPVRGGIGVEVGGFEI